MGNGFAGIAFAQNTRREEEADAVPATVAYNPFRELDLYGVVVLE